jgi:hypothetical protein
MGVVKVLVTSQATIDRLPQQVGERKLRIFPTARVGQTTLFSLCGLAICLGVLRGADLTSEVKRFKGMPALFVNGKLTRPIICFISESKDLKELLEAGFTIVDFTPPFDWIGPEEYDFKKTDAEFESYLKQDPHVLLLPRIDPVPGRWWCDKFPNDITLKSDGRRAGMFGEPCYFSFASETYATLSHRALVALITHLESKYGSRIVGYSPGNGVYGEWFSWSAYWEVPTGTPPPGEFRHGRLRRASSIHLQAVAEGKIPR